MAPALSPFFRDSSFDPFLYAAVGEERNGMLLSVLSALARLDLDPWFEAANLSRLSPSAAKERLTGLLSSLPASQLKAPAAATITRLLGLLPMAAPEAAWSPRGPVVAMKSRTPWPMMGLILIALLMMFAEQLAEQREKGTAGGLASPAASSTESAASKTQRE
jgi:hypothetical protein